MYVCMYLFICMYVCTCVCVCVCVLFLIHEYPRFSSVRLERSPAVGERLVSRTARTGSRSDWATRTSALSAEFPCPLHNKSKHKTKLMLFIVYLMLVFN